MWTTSRIAAGLLKGEGRFLVAIGSGSTENQHASL